MTHLEGPQPTPPPPSTLGVALRSWAWWVVLLAVLLLTASAITARATLDVSGKPVTTAPQPLKWLGERSSPGTFSTAFGAAESDAPLVLGTSAFYGSLPTSLIAIGLGVLAIALLIALVRLGIVVAIMFFVLRAVPYVSAWLATWAAPEAGTTVELARTAVPPAAQAAAHTELGWSGLLPAALIVVAALALWDITRRIHRAERARATRDDA